jgi:hypothetical protein
VHRGYLGRHHSVRAALLIAFDYTSLCTLATEANLTNFLAKGARNPGLRGSR